MWVNYYYYYLKITGWALTLYFPCLEASYAHKEYMKLLSNTPFINVHHAVSQDHRGVCNRVRMIVFTSWTHMRTPQLRAGNSLDSLESTDSAPVLQLRVNLLKLSSFQTHNSRNLRKGYRQHDPDTPSTPTRGSFLAPQGVCYTQMAISMTR